MPKVFAFRAAGLVGALAGLAWVGFVAGAPGQTKSPARRQAAVRTAAASGTAQTVPADVSAALLDMRARAGVIFAGTVMGVARSDAAGFVDVRFRVDEAVLGCRQGNDYVLREWAGLWSGQVERYRVGQRLLLLLTARGPSGMSSPVNGTEGIIPLAPTAAEPLADALGNAPAEDGSVAGGVAGMAADLRWVQTGVARTVGASSDGSSGTFSGGGKVHAATLATPVVGEPDPVTPEPEPPVDRWVGPVAPLPVVASPGAGSAGMLPPSVDAVLTLLRGAGAGAAARTQVQRGR